VRAGGRKQKIASGAVLSRAFVRIKSYRAALSLKTHAIANFAIEPYASPHPNSRSLLMSLGRILKFHLGQAAALRRRKLRRGI